MKSVILFCLSAAIISCNNQKQDKINNSAKDSGIVNNNLAIPVIQVSLTDSIFESSEMNDSIAKVLAPVKENFKRINATKEWTKIDTVEISESLEGGEIVYYYLYNRLQKIIRKDYGETYQTLKEYYLLGKELSFVYEKTLRYNRPMYYDSAAMKEGKDTEAFDINRSDIKEIRSYFIKNKLVKQLASGSEKKSGKNLLEKEEIRLQSDFKKINRK